MTIAASLLIYSVAVIAFGPSLLRRLTRNGEAPRGGVAAWLIAISSVLITWVFAAVLVVEAAAFSRHVLRCCATWRSGTPGVHHRVCCG